MLATDQKQTVLAGVSETAQVASVYSAYGYREEESATHGLIGFNGEVREEGSSWYLLGNGHRVYNPTLMKFHSPDDYGPYGEAGFNLYAYCLGDPVNYVDPTGNVAWLAIPRAIWGGLKSLFGLGKSASKGAGLSVVLAHGREALLLHVAHRRVIRMLRLPATVRFPRPLMLLLR